MPDEIQYDASATPAQFTNNADIVIEQGTHVRVKIIGLRTEVGEMWAIGSINGDFLGYATLGRLMPATLSWIADRLDRAAACRHRMPTDRRAGARLGEGGRVTNCCRVVSFRAGRGRLVYPRSRRCSPLASAQAAGWLMYDSSGNRLAGVPRREPSGRLLSVSVVTLDRRMANGLITARSGRPSDLETLTDRTDMEHSGGLGARPSRSGARSSPPRSRSPISRHAAPASRCLNLDHQLRQSSAVHTCFGAVTRVITAQGLGMPRHRFAASYHPHGPDCLRAPSDLTGSLGAYAVQSTSPRAPSMMEMAATNHDHREPQSRPTHPYRHR